MLVDRIKCNTSTTGTGAITLSATGVRDATNGDCLAPAENLTALANRRVPYFIINGAANGTTAEGFGLISTDGLTLTRDTNEISWNGTTYTQALLSLSGTSTMFISPRAVDLNAASFGINIAANYGAFLN